MISHMALSQFTYNLYPVSVCYLMLPPKSGIKPGPDVCADEGEGQRLKLYSSLPHAWETNIIF